MSRGFIVCVSLLGMMGSLAVAQPPLANAGRKGLEAKSIDEMLALPDEEIDIGLGALLIGKEYDPDLDVPKYLAQLDTMALELRSRIGDETSPRKVIASVNRYIYQECDIHTIKDPGRAPNALFLHTLLDDRKGTCLSLSTLYLGLCERLGLPVFGVAVPRHSFVRYLSPEARINIETTQRGRSRWDFLYKVLYRVPNTEGGKRFFMRNLTKREFLALVLVGTSYTHWEKKKFDEVVEHCEQALAIIPQCGAGWATLGAALDEKGDSDAAMRAYNKALAINPASPKIWFRLGIAHSRKGQLDKALDAYRKALAIDPNNARAWHALASDLEQNGQLDEAVHALEKAVAIDPEDPNAWLNLGSSYTAQGRSEVALRTYRRALQRHPKVSVLWNNLSVELAKAGQVDEAIEALKRSLELGSFFSAVCVSRLVELYCKQGQLDQAIAFLKESRDKDPTSLWPWLGLGLACEQRGKHREAQRVYEEASRIRGDAGQTWLEIGFGYRTLGKVPEAIAAYRKALAANAELSQAWSGLGSAYFDQNELDRAIEACMKATELDPKDWLSFYYLALAYDGKGEPASAWKSAQKCMEIGGKLDADFLKRLRAKMNESDE